MTNDDHFFRRNTCFLFKRWVSEIKWFIIRKFQPHNSLVRVIVTKVVLGGFLAAFFYIVVNIGHCLLELIQLIHKLTVKSIFFIRNDLKKQFGNNIGWYTFDIRENKKSFQYRRTTGTCLYALWSKVIIWFHLSKNQFFTCGGLVFNRLAIRSKSFRFNLWYKLPIHREHF